MVTVKRRKRATTASLKLSLRASWRVGDNVVGRGNADRTSLPMPELLTIVSAEKTERGSLLNRPSCPPPPRPSDDPTDQGTKVTCKPHVRWCEKGLGFCELFCKTHAQWCEQGLAFCELTYKTHVQWCEKGLAFCELTCKTHVQWCEKGLAFCDLSCKTHVQ